MRSLIPTPGNTYPVDAYGRLGRLGPRRPGIRDAYRILNGTALAPPLRLELGHVLEADGHLFLKYRRR